MEQLSSSGTHSLRFRLLCRSLVPGWAVLAWLLLPQVASAQSAVEKLQEFPLDQVQITDSYQKILFAKDVAYLITTLDSDRLLAGFKAVSQGATPTNLYGGWENTNIRGHSLGHWLSAVAQAYQQVLGTDPSLAAQIKTKLDDVCSKLKAYQLASGFLFATPISQFDDFDAGTGSTWVPYYTMHKILAGLVDAYKYGNNADALAVASKLGDWLHSRASGWSSSAKSRVLSQEYGGMNDALYELYKYTKSANHLTVAHVFDDTGLFTAIAAGTDNLNGRHANMTIPKFIGALNRYRTLGSGESPYLTAAQQFLSMVLRSHTYVTGGNSEDEHFRVPGTLDAHRDDDNNETCNAYNMSKLSRDLFKTTSDVKYADYYERVHINEILSSINPETGMTTYFKPMATGYFKAFGSPTSSFWCCTGTGMENFAKLGDSVYFHDAKDLWVTYYVSSTLDWKERGLSLTQTTDLPLTNRVVFTIDAAPLDAVNLRFRKPYWLASCRSMTIAVNGQSMMADDANGFLSVSRVWQAGDRLELSIPAEVQVSRLPDAPNTVAFTYGPLVLSAGLGTASMTTAGHAWTLVATKPTGLQETITVNGGTTINSWLASIKDNLVQAAGKLEFSLKNTDSDAKLAFVPHFSRYKDRYGIYWKLAGTTGATVSPPACPSSGGTSSTGGASGRTNTGGVSGVSGGKGGLGSGGSGGRASSVISTTNSVATGGPLVGLGGATNVHGTAGNGGTRASSSRAFGGAGATDTQANPNLGGHSAGPGASANGNSTTGGAGRSSSAANASGDSSSGCSCRLSDSSARAPWSLGLSIILSLIALRRRRSSEAPKPVAPRASTVTDPGWTNSVIEVKQRDRTVTGIVETRHCHESSGTEDVESDVKDQRTMLYRIPNHTGESSRRITSTDKRKIHAARLTGNPHRDNQTKITPEILDRSLWRDRDGRYQVVVGYAIWSHAVISEF
ncbi:MAG: glycoside hydrolase family 127 protein [Myxococcales bacterium]